MLKPIPASVLAHTAIVAVPESSDAYGSAEWTETEVAKVHLQPVHQFRRTKDDREILLSGVLFWDARRSGAFDWKAAEQTAEAASLPLRVTALGKTYTAVAVDWLPDDKGRLHHVEVSLT